MCMHWQKSGYVTGMMYVLLVGCALSYCEYFAVTLDKYDHKVDASELWIDYTTELGEHLRAECREIDNHNGLKWHPRVFEWPSRAPRLYAAIQRVEWERIRSSRIGRIPLNSSYGPRDIHRARLPRENATVQLDLVQHIWTLHILVKSLHFDLDDQQNVLIEFGGGTGVHQTIRP